MACRYCGGRVDRSGDCLRCAAHAAAATGWRPDPTARFEGRYYVTDRPTNRVRNGRRQFDDATGGAMLPRYVRVSSSRTGIRSTWFGSGLACMVLVLAAGIAWALLRDQHGPPAISPEAGYLAALRDAGLSDQFSSDANAVAHGHQVCRRLEDGEPQQGVPADEVAVKAFCPTFTDGFRVLETATVSGEFVVDDSQGVDVIAADGHSCHGENGYSDVGPATPVTVKSGTGEVLASTTLGPGTGDAAHCTFAFSFPVTEGQDRYVVSIGRRGDFSYGFAQLRQGGVRVHLGS